MTIRELALQQSPALEHHVNQARVWLAASEVGKSTVPLAYAALELRFAVERLAVHYWAGLVVGTDTEAELSDIGAFKSIENRIYQLAGHQREIDRSIEFSELMCSMLGLTLPKGRPNLPMLKRHWHSCSEMCHIGWALACVSPEIGHQSHAVLVAVMTDVDEMLKGTLGIPKIHDAITKEVERAFIAGQITPEEAKRRLSERGLQAEFTPVAGAAPVPLGVAVLPTQVIEISQRTCDGA
jgi:hypothetical protein